MSQLHEREEICMKAKGKLLGALIEFEREFDLTDAERLRIVNDVCSNWIGTLVKYSIRQERHDDPDKPGGLAS